MSAPVPPPPSRASRLSDRNHRALIVVLGDQLSANISSLAAGSKTNDVVLMAEVMDEATYVPHHKKKIAFLFSAMRHFAESLKDAGWSVEYTRLDDHGNTGSFTGEVERVLERHGCAEIIVTEPGEWRVLQAMRSWRDRFGLPVRILDDDRFVCSRSDFAKWAAPRKQLRMEYFYRDMRRRTGLLMNGTEPEGERWNYDADNRKPARGQLKFPNPFRVEPDATTCEVLDLVDARFGNHFGDLRPFWFAVTPADAQAALDHFIDATLPHFGDYQDAMVKDESFVYHSVLSLYINAGLLDPLEVCGRVEAAYRRGDAPLNAAEGFIRQIIGWREYVRGIYWLEMPGYRDRNHFNAERSLPKFYWTGETDMACLHAAITQTKEEAYAHHIQRLMVTGTFAMLAGIDPHAVHEWYLAVYADAYEWVELPNTLGMSQFADGGLLSSKPYAASGNYINKMSDYCRGCHYDVKQKTGDGACPFNSLYWDFLARNRETLEGNPRLAHPYRTWDRMDADRRADTRRSAKQILDALR